ncbi:DUF5110 domain-containing protein [Bradyrhizobium sp. BR 1432]|uniref:DUF5110 domain-containing protein n=1 Tax=Bradyrhizobium sp. BR 1432 TaxID=3447966 RepID=UPI003EE70A96
MRTGTVIPLRQNSDTIPSQSDEQLTLLAVPGNKEGTFTLYDDDRETYRYEEGEHSKQRFAISALAARNSFKLEIGAISGRHKGVLTARRYRIEVPSSCHSTACHTERAAAETRGIASR